MNWIKYKMRKYKNVTFYCEQKATKETVNLKKTENIEITFYMFGNCDFRVALFLFVFCIFKNCNLPVAFFLLVLF